MRTGLMHKSMANTSIPIWTARRDTSLVARASYERPGNISEIAFSVELKPSDVFAIASFFHIRESIPQVYVAQQ